MPGNPQLGDIFANEIALGVAEDQAEVIDLGEQIDIPLPPATFDDKLTSGECNPLAGAEKDIKVQVRGTGIGIDGDLELEEVLVP